MDVPRRRHKPAAIERCGCSEGELWVEGQEMKLKDRMGQTENFFLTILELQMNGQI